MGHNFSRISSNLPTLYNHGPADEGPAENHSQEPQQTDGLSIISSPSPSPPPSQNSSSSDDDLAPSETEAENHVSIATLTADSLTDWNPIRALTTFEWCTTRGHSFRSYMEPMDIVKLLFIRWITVEDLGNNHDATSMLENIQLDKLHQVEPPKLDFEKPSAEERSRLVEQFVLAPCRENQTSTHSSSSEDITQNFFTSEQTSKTSESASTSSTNKRRHRDDSSSSEEEPAKRVKLIPGTAVYPRRKHQPDLSIQASSEFSPAAVPSAPIIKTFYRPKSQNTNAEAGPSLFISVNTLSIKEQLAIFHASREPPSANQGFLTESNLSTLEETPEYSQSKKRRREHSDSSKSTKKRRKSNDKGGVSDDDAKSTSATIGSDDAEEINSALTAIAGRRKVPRSILSQSYPSRNRYAFRSPIPLTRHETLIYYEYKDIPPLDQPIRPIITTAEVMGEERNEKLRRQRYTLFDNSAPVFGRPTPITGADLTPAVGSFNTTTSKLRSRPLSFRNTDLPAINNSNRAIRRLLSCPSIRNSSYKNQTKIPHSDLLHQRIAGTPLGAIIKSNYCRSTPGRGSRSPRNRIHLPGPSRLRNEVRRTPSVGSSTSETTPQHDS